MYMKDLKPGDTFRTDSYYHDHETHFCLPSLTKVEVIKNTFDGFHGRMTVHTDEARGYLAYGRHSLVPSQEDRTRNHSEVQKLAEVVRAYERMVEMWKSAENTFKALQKCRKAVEDAEKSYKVHCDNMERAEKHFADLKSEIKN